MDQFEHFAAFLQDYGPYAMTSVFAFLYMLERKERRDTQAKLELFLATMSEKLQANAITITEAVAALERAMLRAGVEAEDHEHS